MKSDVAGVIPPAAAGADFTVTVIDSSDASATGRPSASSTVKRKAASGFPATAVAPTAVIDDESTERLAATAEAVGLHGDGISSFRYRLQVHHQV